MNKKISIFLLFKIATKEKYLKELQEGYLFMRPLNYFQMLENQQDHQRPDRYEGLSALFQSNKVKIRYGDIEINPDDLDKDVMVTNNTYNMNRYIFCISSVNNRNWSEIPVDKIEHFKKDIFPSNKLNEFGYYVLVITSAQKFINRVKIAIKKTKYSYCMGLVEYYNEDSHHGKFPENKIGFYKRDIFKHQSEYRIMIKFSPELKEESFKFNIGSIKDISIITTMEEFRNKLGITFKG